MEDSEPLIINSHDDSRCVTEGAEVAETALDFYQTLQKKALLLSTANVKCDDVIRHKVMNVRGTVSTKRSRTTVDR